MDASCPAARMSRCHNYIMTGTSQMGRVSDRERDPYAGGVGCRHRLCAGRSHPTPCAAPHGDGAVLPLCWLRGFAEQARLRRALSRRSGQEVSCRCAVRSGGGGRAGADHSGAGCQDVLHSIRVQVQQREVRLSLCHPGPCCARAHTCHVHVLCTCVVHTCHAHVLCPCALQYRSSCRRRSEKVLKVLLLQPWCFFQLADQLAVPVCGRNFAVALLQCG